MVKKCFLFFLAFTSFLILPVFVKAEVLWEQPLNNVGDPVNQQAYYSQEYTDDDDSDLWIADDFVNDEVWDISTIFVPGDFRLPLGSETLLDATALHWRIYADDGGKPNGYPGDGVTTPVVSISLPPDDPQVSIEPGTPGAYPSNVTLTLDTPRRLNAGTYWFVFYPEMPTSTVYGRQPSNTENGFVAQVIQPGGGEGYPTSWTSVLGTTWPVDRFPIALTQQDFAFSIEGTKLYPNIAVTPALVQFGAVLVGTTSVAAQTVTISNSGPVDLTIDAIDITGTSASMFAVIAGGTCGDVPFAIASDSSCTIDVEFAPSAAGLQSAVLAIGSDDPDSSTTNVTLSGIGVEALPSVTEGTIGTEITFSDSPSGFGDRKGKVIIQNAAVKSNTKIAKDDWTRDTVTCIVRKPLPEGTYDVNIMLKPIKDNVVYNLPGAFTFKKPEITSLTSLSGAPLDLITIEGKFFGSKKPKVYMEYLNSKNVTKKKNCPVQLFTWNPQTNASTVQFAVPKGLEPGRIYPLKVETKKVGISAEDIQFTIN